MKKILMIFTILLMLCSVLSASENKILKERTIDYLSDDVHVCLISATFDDGNTLYLVGCKKLDENDVCDMVFCSSLEEAFNVWTMDYYDIIKCSSFFEERVEDKDGTLVLYKYYEFKGR